MTYKWISYHQEVWWFFLVMALYYVTGLANCWICFILKLERSYFEHCRDITAHMVLALQFLSINALRIYWGLLYVKHWSQWVNMLIKQKIILLFVSLCCINYVGFNGGRVFWHYFSNVSRYFLGWLDYLNEGGCFRSITFT